MIEQRWAVTTATGELLYGGSAPYDVVPGLSQGQSRVVLDRVPVPRTERWDGKQLVLKTAQEIAAYDVTHAPPVPIEQRVTALEAKVK